MSDSIKAMCAELDGMATRLMLRFGRFSSESLEAERIEKIAKRLRSLGDSLRQVPEVGDNANISDVLCASFGQYFDVSGIVELDIQDDDQVRPLIAYMAQGVADHFLRDGNKLANLLYSMGEAVQRPEWERVQRELIEYRHTELKLLALIPGAYYMDPPDGGSVSMIEQLQRMADDASMWRQHVHKEANPAPTTSVEVETFDDLVRKSQPVRTFDEIADPTPAQVGAEFPGGEFSDWFEDWASQNQVNQVRAPNGTLLDPESARVEQAYLSACMTSAIHYMELCRQEACQAAPAAGKCPKNCGCVVHCRREQLAVAALPEDIEEAISALRICRDHIQNYCPAGGLGSNKETPIRIADAAIARLARRGGS